MALWIRIAEGAVVSTAVSPANGKSFTLTELNRFVGGYIEALTLDDGRVVWLNEEGKRHRLPINPVADLLAHKQTGIASWDRIVGDVLIATPEESGEGQEEEE